MQGMLNNTMTVKFHKIKYGSQIIPFELEHRKRRTLEISVYPDLSIKVKAPLDRTIEEVRDKIRKRALWILEQRYFFSLYLPKQPEKTYFSGEAHYYLGKQYRLKISKSNIEEVVLKRGMFLVYTKDRKKQSHIKTLLEKWYLAHAREQFEKRISLCVKKASNYGIEVPELQIRKMSKRWGSCSKRGRITLNIHLVKAPSHCIDYVIMHELCHVKFFNHGKNFYNLLNKVMPDWQRRKKRLEEIVF